MAPNIRSFFSVESLPKLTVNNDSDSEEEATIQRHDTNLRSWQEQQEPQEKPSFYKLSAALLPDDLFRNDADVNDWIGWKNNDNDNDQNESSNGKTKNILQQKLDSKSKSQPSQESNPQSPNSLPWMETTCNPNGFPSKSLGRVIPLDFWVDLERCIGTPMYLVANVTPIVVPMATLLYIILRQEWARHLAMAISVYHGSLYAIWRIFLAPIFQKRYHHAAKFDPSQGPFHNQYTFTTRNLTMYCSTSYVWPQTLQRPALQQGPNNDRPVIYCLIPHGLAPYGIVGYPYFSKLWNSKLCSWTCAPIVLKLPFVGRYLAATGYVPANSKSIRKSLQQDKNVGIILDGIDGMFRSQSGNDQHKEYGTILHRKGICKIALQANVAMVPVYGFGHTEIYDIVTDPFGILQWLSSKLHVSLTPFFGRWGWFLGPPKRNVPITVCLGDPILPRPRRQRDAAITQDEIDEHHARLLNGFTQVFETHKTAYYGEELGSKKRLVFVR